MNKLMRSFLLALVVTFSLQAKAQNEQVVDQVVAVVGKNIILKSEVETQYLQFRMQGLVKGSNKAKCEILENLLFQKLLLNQAELDSIVVSDEMVERNMEQRISYFVQQIGSEEKLEEYYNKSISQLKEEFRDLIKEQMLVDQAQSSITADVTVTPSEVKKFYESIPSDSIPEVGTQYEISQIVIDPPIGPKEIMETREKLNSMRTRIVNGESFSTLAILYSEDPGSAAKGGELGFHRRGDFYPEFEAVAFNLKKGQISEIVKTEAGFHIIELMEQRGESFNFRHILIQPKVNIEDIQAAIDELDSLTVIINKGDITFEEAAAKNSDDKNKDNGGLLVNPMTSTTMWGDDQLDQNMKFTIMRMKEGDISKPIEMVTDKNKKAYRIIKLNKRIAPHKANMEQDYNQIKDWATEEKKGRVIQDWINTKTKDTYVRILDSFSDCDFEHTWTK